LTNTFRSLLRCMKELVEIESFKLTLDPVKSSQVDIDIVHFVVCGRSQVRN
jgi:hypothetical protein